MPRARVPNVSLIASADLPILPYLAPSVFAQVPRFQRQNKHNHGVQKEKKKAVSFNEKPDWKESGQRRRWSSGLNTRLCPGRASTTTALLQTSNTRWNDTSNRFRSRHMNCIYADISSAAPQHMRSYATATSGTERGKGRKRPAIRRVEGKNSLSRGGSISRKPSEKDLKARRTRTSSVLAPHGSRQAAQREKALALERQRLYEFISRLPSGLTATQRLQKGQYRSICRRIYNLQSWNTTQITLRTLLTSASGTSWLVRAFAALDRALYPSIGRHTRKIVLRHDPRCPRWSRTLFPAGIKVGSHQVWTTWMGFDVTTRREAFRKLLFYLLDRKPGRALRFIQVLANDPLLRNNKTEIIADALGHLSKIHNNQKLYISRKEWGQDADANKRSFLPAFVHIFKKSLAGMPDVCSQDLLYNLVGLATTEDLKKVFDCLVAARTRFSFDTLLHYANAFGEASEAQYALRCLQELRSRHGAVAWQSVVDRERLRWTCAVILRKSMNKSQNYHETTGIVAAFVELGIKMDILLYNVVMHNAMEAGDHVTAFKVYDTLESNALKADKHTFSILLHGCTTQNNPAMFFEFAQHCAEVAKEMRDPWLATDYLYYLYVRHQNSDPAYRSNVLWRAYLSHFSVPLELFARPEVAYLKHAVDSDMTRSDSTTLEPTSVALYIMLQVELESTLLISNQRVLNLYQRFKSVTNNPNLKPLVQDPTMWNAFLLAFCQKQQFANASQLITDMMNSSTQPNVYSWNIFMQAFFKTGQVQAAERVFDIMRHKSIEPDQFSYGVMLRGFARAQLIERIGETMQYVNTEHEMNPELLRALAQMANRKQLMTVLDNSRAVKETNAQEKADRDAKEEQERWKEAEFWTPLDASLTTARPNVDEGIEATTPELQYLSEFPRFPLEPIIDNEPLEIPEDADDFVSCNAPAADQDSPLVAQDQQDFSAGLQASQEPFSDDQTPASNFPSPAVAENETGAETFSFLQDDVSSFDETSPATLLNAPQQPSPLPAPTDLTPHHEPRNPKAQFRALQHKLNTDPNAPSMRSFGANLGFKSMIGKGENDGDEADQDSAGLNGEVNFGSMLREQVRLAGPRQRTAVKVRKIALRDDKESTTTGSAKDKAAAANPNDKPAAVHAKGSKKGKSQSAKRKTRKNMERQVDRT